MIRELTKDALRKAEFQSFPVLSWAIPMLAEAAAVLDTILKPILQQVSKMPFVRGAA